MTPSEWSRLQQIASEVLDLPVAERDACLDRACGADTDLRRRVLALVEASGDAEEFFDQAFGGLASEMLAEDPAEQQATYTAPSIGVGQRIGRYVIEGVLGSGGMGVAFAARDTELDRTVALKFVRLRALESSTFVDDESAENQVREAKAASALNHPYIVTVHEVLRSEFGVAIVMEMVDGQVLRTLCGQAQPIERVLRIGEQMAEALAASSAAGIVHSDIKPENVVARPDGYIKILDFGLARRMDARLVGRPELLAGSYLYMSPEQTRGEKLSGASDVFSMATVLFELAAGTRPFADGTALQTMMAIGSGEPKLLEQVKPSAPREFSELLRQMMAKDPSARPSAREVAARLKALREGVSQELSSPAVPLPAKRGRERALAVAGLVVSFAMGGILWWNAAERVKPQPKLSEAIPFARDGKEASISPDGRAAAYTCTEGLWSQICVKAFTSSKDEKFGRPGTNNSNPVWSPDGRTLAYLAVTGMEKAAIVLRNRADGAEHTLAEIETTGGIYGRSMCWSAKGDGLIVSANLRAQDSFELFVVSKQGGELRRLTTPPQMGRPFGDRAPSISPDGRWLAFSRIKADGLADLYVVALSADTTTVGEPRKVETGRPWNVTPVWTADGKALVFSMGTLRQYRLARVSAFEREEPTIVPGSVVGSASAPAIGKDASGRPILLFTNQLSITNLWEAAVGRPTRAGMRQLTSPSSSRDFQPSYAHDGKRFAFVSDRSGYEEVWVADADGGHATQWTHMECGKVAIPRWSPDGSRITFSAVCGGQGSVYEISGAGQKPLLLTEPGALNENSRWFPDGQWLYFTSFRTGASTTWKVAEGGRPAVPFSTRMTSNPQASWDGKTMYFTRVAGAKLGLWKTSVEQPLKEEQVMETVGDYVVGRQGIYFTAATVESGTEVRFLDFGSGKISIAAVLPQPQYIFDVSADGKKIIWARNYLATEDLFRVDGFR